MRRIIAVLLAVGLVATLTVPAFAAMPVHDSASFFRLGFQLNELRKQAKSYASLSRYFYRYRKSWPLTAFTHCVAGRSWAKGWGGAMQPFEAWAEVARSRALVLCPRPEDGEEINVATRNLDAIVSAANNAISAVGNSEMEQRYYYNAAIDYALTDMIDSSDVGRANNALLQRILASLVTSNAQYRDMMRVQNKLVMVNATAALSQYNALVAWTAAQRQRRQNYPDMVGLKRGVWQRALTRR